MILTFELDLNIVKYVGQKSFLSKSIDADKTNRTIALLQCVSKKDTAWACYNFYVHQPILIFYGSRNVTREQAVKL